MTGPHSVPLCCRYRRVWLCDPMDCSPPDTSVHGILHVRIQEWVAMPSSRGSSWPRDQTHFSYVSCIGRQILYHWCHLGSPLSHYFMANRRGKSRSNDRFYFLGLQNYCERWLLGFELLHELQHTRPAFPSAMKIKGHLLLGRKAMTNVDSVLTS